MHRGHDGDGLLYGSGSGEIKIESLTKMEGHGSLAIKIKDKKVEYVKLKITESKRFYTQAIRGKSALALPLVTSRICGTCSIAHLTCCSQAVEDAFDYIPSEQTILLRKLSLYGMMIRDHALHLYLFCLPDIFGKDSVLDFDKSDDDLVKKAFAIKSAGNNLSKVIAGRAVHATFAEVGKFSHIPEKEQVSGLIKELESVRDYVIEFIEIFYNSKFDLGHDTDFVSLITKDYSFVNGMIEDSKGYCILENSYQNYIQKVVLPYSEAVGYRYKGRRYMVGALARMNLNRENMHRYTRKDASKYTKGFPSHNIFDNNLAQSIEILHCIDHSLEILQSSSFREERSDPLKIREGIGFGMLEAPRGLLYYMLSIDKSGKIREGNIIVPTQQNQICMEHSVAELVRNNMNKKREQIEYEIEKLIRAYDPCMSCASHFLKIDWK